MPFTRTRIWRHGITQLLNPTADSDPAASLHTTLPGFETPPNKREAAPTRVLPIEQLFPGMQSYAAPATHTRTEEPLTATCDSQRTSRMFVLRARHWHALKVAFATIIVTLVIYLALQPPEPAGTQPDTPRAAPPAVQAIRAQALESRPARATAATTASPAPPGLERAAVNALIAGDYALARSLYQQLASATPSASVYGEAARILSARTTAPAP